MRSFTCQCGATLFFESTQCVACRRQTAMCPHCNAVGAMKPLDDGTFACHHCREPLQMCQNRVQYAACNRGMPADSPAGLCRYCKLNKVIPDLTISGNLWKWQRLEAAKHRVLYDIDRIGLPLIDETPADRTPADDRRQPEGPTLRFEFKAADTTNVSTGHADGLITIDIAEADSVKREQLRVEFGEPQRTLIGHFRHELGHYYWDLSVKPRYLTEFCDLFGDHRTPAYGEAQQRYYAQGPAQDWQTSYISAYATMHPWEDFAETFAGYLDMIAIVETARHFERTKVAADGRDFDALLVAYRDIGIIANEFNRDMGLLDLVPEVFTEPVVDKLRFVHSLRQI